MLDAYVSLSQQLVLLRGDGIQKVGVLLAKAATAVSSDAVLFFLQRCYNMRNLLPESLKVQPRPTE